MEDFVKSATKLEQQAKSLKEEFQNRENELQKKEKRFLKTKEDMTKFKIEDPVELNVGGRSFTTFKSTLIKEEGSMLEAMFSGRHPPIKDTKGRFFIDRSPESFVYVINYLRTGKLVYPNDPYVKNLFISDLSYFGLESDPPTSLQFESILLSQEKQNQLHNFFDEKEKLKKWNLLYRASKSGFESAKFHSKCDNKGETITIIKSNQNLFGGYNPISWNQGGWSNDSRYWLFSLTNPSNLPCKMKVKNPQQSAYNDSSCGPTFGGGHDFYISNQSNQNSISYTNLGHSYELPTGVSDGRTFFVGSYNFTVTDIEVFGVAN